MHSHSREMSDQISKEFPFLPRYTVQNSVDFEIVDKEIRRRYVNDANILRTLDKISRRKDVVDHDLCGVMPAGLLVMVWRDIIKPNEAYKHFQDTMEDMGCHCIQGDTHRLFSTFVAFNRKSYI